MTLKSNAFNDGGLIPVKYTCCCEGDNISPQLSWNNVPEGATSFALIVTDADAHNKNGSPFAHWLVFNLPSALRELVENVDLATISGALVGRNDFETLDYKGPCLKKNSLLHHYHFTLYALDSVLSLAEGTTQNDIIDAIEGHALDSSTVIGTYIRS